MKFIIDYLVGFLRDIHNKLGWISGAICLTYLLCRYGDEETGRYIDAKIKYLEGEIKKKEAGLDKTEKTDG